MTLQQYCSLIDVLISGIRTRLLPEVTGTASGLLFKGSIHGRARLEPRFEAHAFDRAREAALAGLEVTTAEEVVADYLL